MLRASRFRLLPSCLAFAAFAVSATLAQEVPPHFSGIARFPTTNDLRQLKVINSVALSPDGHQALFTMLDTTADGAKSHLWLVNTSGASQPRQLTFSPPSDKHGEHDAAWLPDGHAIFFLAKRGEQTQLFRLDLRGGDASPFDLKILPPVDDSTSAYAVPLSALKAEAEKSAASTPTISSDKSAKDTQAAPKPKPVEIDVAGYALSHDGHWLALWAKDPQTPGEKKEKTAKADADWIDHNTHLTRLYLAALGPDGVISGSLEPVAVAPDVKHAEWSPASDELLVFTERPNNASDLGPAGAAWLVRAAASAQAEKLAAIPATISGGAFSPTGSTIVFSAQTPQDAPPGYDDLFALPGSGHGTPARLTAGFPGQLSARDLAFESDSSLLTISEIGTRSMPVRIALSGASHPQSINLGSGVVTSLATNPARTGWLWLAQSGGHPMQLCFAAKLGQPCRTLPTPALAPQGLRTIAPQRVTWKSGNLTIEGLLYLPPQAATSKVPLIVDVHGGPLGAWTNGYDPWADLLLGHGWAILRPNPRGSSNYGVTFAAANKNDLGGGDYRDIMAGVDSVLARFPLDPHRIALIGYSYGGEMAGFVEGKTDRFKAIVCGAPVIDQFSEYGTEGGSWYDRWYFGKPWEHFADAWRQSPLSGAAHAKTPFMLLQGQADTTDPIGQSEEMYRALRQEGIPVQLLTFPRENHGPLAGGIFGRPSPEPWHGYQARRHILDFLQQYLGSTQP
ncbi:MAG TPA: prolyl oligopeptidase family serine peptidase [Terracidiphilus sp.]|nr:prolyl oligopeptidase family serine peptidase [Terracidiphilus sp.]